MSVRHYVTRTKERLCEYACSILTGSCVLFASQIGTSFTYAQEISQHSISAATERVVEELVDQSEPSRDPRIRRFNEVPGWPNSNDDAGFQPTRVAANVGDLPVAPQVADPHPIESVVVAEPVGDEHAHGHTAASQTADSADASDYWWQAPIKRQQREATQRLDVSLNGLLVSALSNSARIQVLADEPLITETEITTADANFDWYSFLEARWDDVDEPVGSTLTTGGPDRFRDHNVNVSAGIRRRNTIGGEVEISQRLGHQNNNSVFFVPNNQGTSRLTLSYSQPLLRGAGRVYNTSFTVLAKLNTDIANDEFNRQLQDHLLDITQSYWNLYFERGKLLQQEKLLDSGVKILEELESREGVDALQSQIVRARAAVENRRAQLIRARLSIRIAEARVRALVNDPALGDTMNSELVPVEDISESPLNVDLRDAIATAMKNRPEVNAAMTQVKAACVRMNLSKNETLPLLNVVLDSYLAGLEGRSRVFGAWSDQFTEGVPSYGIGLQYEYPFWNRAAQSKLQKRRLELRRLQHQFRQTTETLKLEVEVAVHELNAAFESLNAKRRAMEAANAEVDYLRDRWQLLPVDNGSASLLLEDLLDAQDRLTDSEQSLLQSTLEYGLAQVTYKKAIGGLLTYNAIDIQRGCECKLPTQRAVQNAIPVGHQSHYSTVPAETTHVVTPTESPESKELSNFYQTEGASPAMRPSLDRLPVEATVGKASPQVPLSMIAPPAPTAPTADEVQADIDKHAAAKRLSTLEEDKSPVPMPKAFNSAPAIQPSITHLPAPEVPFTVTPPALKQSGSKESAPSGLNQTSLAPERAAPVKMETESILDGPIPVARKVRFGDDAPRLSRKSTRSNDQ